MCEYEITFVRTLCLFDLFFFVELLQTRACSNFVAGRLWLVPSSSMMAFALHTSSSNAFFIVGNWRRADTDTFSLALHTVVSKVVILVYVSI